MANAPKDSLNHSEGRLPLMRIHMPISEDVTLERLLMSEVLSRQSMGRSLSTLLALEVTLSYQHGMHPLY
jgi:hypothetical protein